MKEYSIYELNQRQQYMMLMRPLLHKHALFSDGTRDYRDPPEPEECMVLFSQYHAFHRILHKLSFKQRLKLISAYFFLFQQKIRAFMENRFMLLKNAL